jgi:hypothetical protein
VGHKGLGLLPHNLADGIIIILVYAATQMNLENIVLREIIQIQRINIV